MTTAMAAGKKIAVSSDERTSLTDFLIKDLQRRGHEVLCFGALMEDTPPAAGQTAPETDWPLASRNAALAVAHGEADEAVVCCWTGTGASIAANKVAGIRAALCGDAETARGARIWNHANVLALSLRVTSEAIAKEMLDAWFSTPFGEGEWNRLQIGRIAEADRLRDA